MLCSCCLCSLWGPPSQKVAANGCPACLRRGWCRAVGLAARGGRHQQLDDGETGEDVHNKRLFKTLKGSVVLVEDCLSQTLVTSTCTKKFKLHGDPVKMHLNTTLDTSFP